MNTTNKILTNNNRFKPESPDYRRAYLLNCILIFFTIVCIVYFFLNEYSSCIFPSYFNLTGAVCAIILLIIFHLTDKVKLVSYLTVFLLFLYLVLFIYFVQNKFFGFMWLCIFPPIAYFLLGRIKGFIASLLFFTYFIVFIIVSNTNWSATEFTLNSVLNIAGSLSVIIILIGYYERSRKYITDAYLINNIKLTQAVNELSQNKDHLRLILDSAAEGIFGVDTEGNCTFCNQSCVKLLGYNSQNEILGKNMHTLTKHSNAKGKKISNKNCKIHNCIAAAKKLHEDSEIFYKADGTPIYVEYYCHPQYEDGKLTGAVITFLDISERKKNEESIKFLNTHDMLTGLLNRSGFEDEIKKIDNKNNLPLSVIFCDLNGLKLTNDIFGHGEGDQLIIKAAQTLKKICRGKDIVARTGGDEFVIVMKKTDTDAAKYVINRVKNILAKEYVQAVKLSMSMGCDTKTDTEQSIERTIENAENDMYKVKTMYRKYNNFKMIVTIISYLHKKSPKEKEHSVAVSKLCAKLAKKMGLSQTELKKLKDAGYYHDIGKVVLSDSVLNKGVILSEEERSKKRLHSVIGYRILNLFDFTLDLAEGVYSHHERWDGSGYPKGLKGEEIPLAARIIAVAEHYDKITGDYIKNPFTKKQALEKLKKMAGIHFDPRITDIFVNMIAKEENIKLD